MTGEIAQMVALACHANAFLRGGAVSLTLANSAFRFCDRVRFVEMKRRWLGKRVETTLAETPDEWLAYLARQGAAGVRLVWNARRHRWLSDRMSAGLVGGGGTWVMETLLPGRRAEAWVSRWEVWNREAPEQRIWRVIYSRPSRWRASPAGPGLAPAEDSLLQALREIHAFSQQHELGGFTECFARAIAALTGPARSGYHQDLAPPGLLGERAAAVLNACQSAWVFGGMGSWNDLAVVGESEYERVSEALFQAITAGICAAVNSAAP